MIENAKNLLLNSFGAPSVSLQQPLNCRCNHFRSGYRNFFSRLWFAIPGRNDELPRRIKPGSARHGKNCSRTEIQTSGRRTCSRSQKRRSSTLYFRGISTDHECYTIQEAIDKLQYGMKILIREGSAAKNFTALIPLMDEYADSLMFCSDDKHPDDLELGHINLLVQRAIAAGYDTMNAAFCDSELVKHYGLNVGLLQQGDPADFIVVNNLKIFRFWRLLSADKSWQIMATAPCPKFNILSSTTFPVYRKQRKIFCPLWRGNSECNWSAGWSTHYIAYSVRGKNWKWKSCFRHRKRCSENCRCKQIFEQTSCHWNDPEFWHQKRCDGFLCRARFPQHHCRRVTDEDICRAVNLLIQNQGGLCVIDGTEESVLPLPIAGLISPQDGVSVSKQYSLLDKK